MAIHGKVKGVLQAGLVAGIVPVAGYSSDIPECGFPWHNSMMPVGDNYMAVERAIVECAYAGASSIYVVCNYDMQPMLRYRIGEAIEDPVYAYRKFTKFPRDHKRKIPIYYVAISPQDLNKRDCLGWSVLHGVFIANRFHSNISNLLSPNRFYVAFPYAGYRYFFLRDERRYISNQYSFCISHEGRTIADGEMLGFTMTYDEYEMILENFKQKASGMFNTAEDGSITLRPLEDRYSGKNFKLEFIFRGMKEVFEDQNNREAPIEKYYPFTTWPSYSKYMGEVGFNLKRSSLFIKSTDNWVGMSVEPEEEMI